MQIHRNPGSNDINKTFCILNEMYKILLNQTIQVLFSQWILLYDVFLIFKK